MSKDKFIDKAIEMVSRKKISRKQFGRWFAGAIGAAVTAKTMTGCAPAEESGASFQDNLESNINHDYEAVIVGSGFGGSVTAARLSRKWPGRVLMVERGRRYPKGSFPRDAASLVDAVRRDASDHTPRPIPIPGKSNGLFDVRSYNGMDVLVANGYGGGSLIYGAAIIEPTDPRFDQNWPTTIKRDELKPYYDLFKNIMGVQQIPVTDEPERQMPRIEYYQKVAEETGATSELVQIGVFFGNDPERPLPLGETAVNKHGAEQTSCTYCAECVLGCNYHSKTSMDLSFLHVAENRYGMEVRTEQAVDRIAPLDIDGNEDAEQDGSYGYRVYMKGMAEGEGETTITARRVILSAGVLGTNEILLRNKRLHKTLTQVSRQLGRRFSGNGDFVGLVAGSDVPDGNAYGPTVTQAIRYDDPNNPERSHVLEDLSLPHLSQVLDWLLDACDTGGPMHGFWKTMSDIMERDGNGKNSGFATQVFVGIDKSDGEMSLGSRGELRLTWSHWASRNLFGAIVNRLRDAQFAVSGWANFYLPTYVWPFRRNLTVHPLGGCALGEDRYSGVTSAAREDFGQVFGYRHLYVADGSLIPSALGANPALTISAFAEIVAEGITGETPTAEL